MYKLISFLLFLIIPSLSFAQSCPLNYNQSEQNYVKNKIDIVTDVLQRLHFLAVQCNQLDLNPRTQRAAMNAEYQALMAEITRIGDGPHPKRISKRTVAFLNTIVDSSFLKLVGSSLDANTREEAIANTYQAIYLNMDALVTLEKCL